MGLTSTQRAALEWLRAKRDATPLTKWSLSGFNPPSGMKAEVASMRRALAQRGLVKVTRISDRHLRYDITDTGRQALSLTQEQPNDP